LAASGTSLAAGTAVTVTLAGCTIGVARPATDSVTVQTNTDLVNSSPAVSSGVIGGAVTSVSFFVAPGDRVAGKTGVQATFAFTPSAGGAGPSTVTLNYPAGFFATSATPTATSSTSGAILTPAKPGATSIVLAASGTSLAAGAAVNVSLFNVTIGISRESTDSITIQTSSDILHSTPNASCGVVVSFVSSSLLTDVVASTNNVTVLITIVSVVCCIAILGFGVWKYRANLQAPAQSSNIDIRKSFSSINTSFSSLGPSFSTTGSYSPQKISIPPVSPDMMIQLDDPEALTELSSMEGQNVYEPELSLAYWRETDHQTNSMGLGSMKSQNVYEPELSLAYWLETDHQTNSIRLGSMEGTNSYEPELSLAYWRETDHQTNSMRLGSMEGTNSYEPELSLAYWLETDYQTKSGTRK
jgi:hypothetical protein